MRASNVSRLASCLIALGDVLESAAFCYLAVLSAVADYWPVSAATLAWPSSSAGSSKCCHSEGYAEESDPTSSSCSAPVACCSVSGTEVQQLKQTALSEAALAPKPLPFPSA